MITFPNAKINLGLKIVEKRLDGYHNIETVFYPIELCDALEIIESAELKIDVTGLVPTGSPEENLVVKAYQLLKRDLGLPPVHIHLHKNIPSGAGLGGGSSDGAFMLKLLNSFFSLHFKTVQLEQYARELGADCPFFIRNKPAHGSGIGDILSETDPNLSDYKILIIKPPLSVNTAEAYRNIKPSVPVVSLNHLLKLPVSEWRDKIINDFEEPVFKQFPEIGIIKENLYKAGAEFALMSGSGSAVYGLFRILPANPAVLAPKGSF
ncbi:MAG: 4-(cytidine 5'-diphospho)-2-C-methyl-D-erythritol kinase, partial [Prolixibacteraceae bacterium]|nr:4-(cytidine 5'-diphospho)-2-C-methyl-D-erythritol kinase [Prolixibacteraceae bacterium]